MSDLIFDGLLMTPGPVMVSERVRAAGAINAAHHRDKAVSDFYDGLCKRISSLLGTKNPTYILNGEGMLGLDAAVCSVVEPEDRVLVLDNGIYGRGFAPMAEASGGKAVVWHFDGTKPIDVNELDRCLAEDHDFACAFIVHCDTPTGILNPAEDICSLLKKYGIISVVDSVAAFPGESFCGDAADILLGGSQKCWSAPSGLSLVTVSEKAREKMFGRKTPIASFYSNLPIFIKSLEENGFAYTMPVAELYAFGEAVSAVEEEGLEVFQKRHADCGAYTRERLLSMGFSLYLQDGFASTVTAFKAKSDVNKFREYMRQEYNICIADSLAEFKGVLMRIGHMGENCRMEYLIKTCDAVEKTAAHFADEKTFGT